MLRIANPGSNIPNILRIFTELYDSLRECESFNLDDFTQVLIMRNLATSCGYIGDEALARSTRKDRSRDPLYNQSKMYSELFKMLGWIHPTEEGALRFRFTYLGAHVPECQYDPVLFFSQCALGIVFPNHIIRNVGGYINRPFSAIIRTMDKLDGLLSRDEMIIGPLSLINDRDTSSFNKMILLLKELREGPYGGILQHLMSIRRTRRIALNTMRNYTRFPLAVLRWTRWVQVVQTRDYYQKNVTFLSITEKGHKYAQQLNNSIDIRTQDLNHLSETDKRSLIKVSVFQMLNRSGFDTSAINVKLSKDIENVKMIYGDKDLLFSPFQELEPTLMSSLFPSQTVGENNNHIMQPQSESHFSRPLNLTTTVRLSDDISSIQGNESVYLSKFKRIYRRTNNLGNAIETYIRMIENYNRDRYYPLIVELFSVLGYKCQQSRVGVNSERWDAIIIDEVESIPIEIKSPGEEKFISVKAIRQALENKIILLSRKTYPTISKTTSLVVGFNLPNNRSEVQELIANIYNAFDISIGVIDIRSLLFLVGMVMLFNKKHHKTDIQHMKGIINVSTT
jgi:hypothetical protein